MSGGAFGRIPFFTAQGNGAARMLAPDPFPPRFSVWRDADIREDRVSIYRVHHLRVGFDTCPGCDTKEAGFGVYGVEIAVGSDVHPRDVVADGPDFVSLIFESRNHHGEIGLTARARKCGAHVSDF